MFGVRVEKWLGDGVMLVGVDPEPLVGAALAIEQRHQKIGQLQLRGGIACGAVILLEGDDYVGRAVNLASRLCDVAEPGQLLAASDNLELPEWVEAEELPAVHVKGMAEEVPLCRAAARPRRAASASRAPAPRRRCLRWSRASPARSATSPARPVNQVSNLPRQPAEDGRDHVAGS